MKDRKDTDKPLEEFELATRYNYSNDEKAAIIEVGILWEIGILKKYVFLYLNFR